MPRFFTSNGLSTEQLWVLNMHNYGNLLQNRPCQGFLHIYFKSHPFRMSENVKD